MRAAARLLANVKGSRALEAYAPTGLTGLHTHPSPRSALLYTYRATLNKLSELPESSVYRKSTEALTQQRLKIVEAEVPAGLDEWTKSVKTYFEKNPGIAEQIRKGETIYKPSSFKDGGFLSVQDQGEEDDLSEEWGGTKGGTVLEGSYTEEEKQRADHFGVYKVGRGGNIDILEQEPQLDLDQIATIEKGIGAGLIEEVLEVAEGELKLVETMTEAQVWEDLEEKPVEGQWTYFERQGTKGT